jgi:VCBS repeat-containing protein
MAPLQHPGFGGQYALVLPPGGSLTIANAPPGFIQSLYNTPVPKLSTLIASFGAVTNFDFQYPLIPVAITVTGTVNIDGTTYVIGGSQLNARLADRNDPIFNIIANTSGGNNQITYLINPERFSLGTSIAAGLSGETGNLSLSVNDTFGAGSLTLTLQAGSGAPDTASASLSFGDANLTDTHTVASSLISAVCSGGGTIPSDTQSALTSALSTALADSARTGAGLVSANFSLADSLAGFLAAGQTLTVVYNVTLTNAAGVNSIQPVTFVIAGPSAVTVAVAPDTLANHTLSEQAGISGSATPDTTSASLSFTDNNPSATHTAFAALKSAIWSGGGVLPAATQGALPAALSAVLTDGAGSGSVALNFSLADNLVDFLSAGETLTLVYNVTVFENGKPGSAAQPVNFTITGTNDAPVLSGGLMGAGSGMTVTALYAPGSTVNLLAGLPPLTTTNAYALTSATTGYNFMGGNGWFAANGINANSLIGGTIVFADGTSRQVASASNGGSGSESAYVYYQPGPMSARPLNLTEAAGVTGSPALDNASQTLAFTDVDLTDTHTATYTLASSAWSGGATIPSATAGALASALSLSKTDSTGSGAGSVGASFSMPDKLVDFLAAGETLTVVYNVKITDKAGLSSTQPVTFTITGTNDAPVLAGGVPDLSSAANLAPGAGSGVTVTALYAPGSTVNLLAGLPTLTTASAYSPTSAGTGYNYMGGHTWFAAHGINVASLAGGTIVFANGTSHQITSASNGSGTSESAYVSYLDYVPGHANLTEIAGATASSTADSTFQTLAFSDVDLTDTHSVSSSLASSSWSGGASIPVTTTTALASALTLTETDSTGTGTGSIAAKLSLADKLVDFLAAGETLTLVYNVTVTDKAGLNSTQPVTFTITGTNDAPVLSAMGAGSGVSVTALYAPGGTVNLLAGLPALATSNAYQWTPGAATGYNYLGGNNWFAANGINIASLVGGTIVFADGATSRISFASNGNPSESAYVYYQPVATIGHATLTEIAGATASTTADKAYQTLAFTDVDLTDVHTATYSLASSTWSGGATIPAATASALASALSLAKMDSTGSGTGMVRASLSLADKLVDFLAAGETLTVLYNVKVTDKGGLSSIQPLTFTITGTNDAPVLNAIGAGSAVTVTALYAPSSSVNLLAGLPALISSDAYQWSPGATAGYNYVGGHNWFTANGINVASLAGGTIVLADGTSCTISYASNGAGTSESAFIYYQATPTTGHANLTEIAGATASATADKASQTLAFSDVDLTDTHMTTYSLASSTWSGGANIPAATLAALASALSLTETDSTGTGKGAVAATFSLADKLVDFLAAGETLTLVYNVKVTDGGGLSSTQPVTFTITGTNDAPALSADTVSNHALSEQIGASGSTAGSASLTFQDPDLTDTHTLSNALGSAVWSGGTLSSSAQAALASALSGVLSDSAGSGAGSVALNFGIANSALNFLAAGQTLTVVYNVTVTDKGGLSSTEPVTFTITATSNPSAPTMRVSSAKVKETSSAVAHPLSGSQTAHADVLVVVRPLSESHPLNPRLQAFIGEMASFFSPSGAHIERGVDSAPALQPVAIAATRGAVIA